MLRSNWFARFVTTCVIGTLSPGTVQAQNHPWTTATQSGKPLIIDKSCGNSSYGACFPIHARFTSYTGDGQEVLWAVGAHRLFRSVSDNGPLYSVIMDGKEFEIHEFVEMAGEYSVMGDFVVCPREEDVPGAMRNVCIKTAANLKRVKRKN